MSKTITLLETYKSFFYRQKIDSRYALKKQNKTKKGGKAKNKLMR